MTFVMPIYYTQEFKTKDPKTTLVGMNKWATEHYHLKNKIKSSLEDDLIKQIQDANLGPILTPYKVHYKLYWKNPSSDGSNIVALSEKIFLDAIQKADLVQEDNVKWHMGSTWENIGQDKENPRVEITISEA
jgi:hypothetical protein